MTDLELEREGYKNIKHFDNGDTAAIMPLLYTTAIVAGINDCGYDDRWCYKTEKAAVDALNAWDGEGEPTGWHRHPPSGRRVSEDGSIEVRF
jgi:hypothetical protein